VKNERLLWDRLSGPRLAVNLKGAEHVTPSDAVWLAKGAVMTGSVDPDKTIAAIRSLHRGDPKLHHGVSRCQSSGPTLDSLLEPLSSAYPDALVTTERQSLGNEGADQAPAARN
jgi:hypothetical protein